MADLCLADCHALFLGFSLRAVSDWRQVSREFYLSNQIRLLVNLGCSGLIRINRELSCLIPLNLDNSGPFRLILNCDHINPLLSKLQLKNHVIIRARNFLSHYIVNVRSSPIEAW